VRTVRWYWFLAPEPLLALFFAVSGVGLFIMEWGRKAWLYPGIGYAIVSTAWYVLIFRRLGRDKADPPIYFRVFWLAILCLEGIVVLACA
jgi:uncharacterized membrane protein SirB2